MSNLIHALEELQLPKQLSNKLTFCGIKPKQLLSWLNDTANTETKQISILFYKLLPEINQLKISGSHRLSLLIIIRPHIYRCVSGLADEFLKHPLSLTENMTKIAAIAQALQRHLSDGFILSAYQLFQSKKLSENTLQELSLALFYASHGLGQLLLRSCQIYTPRPPMLWRKLHLIHQIAHEHGLENKTIADELLHSNKYLTIKRSYLQSALLASSQVNQLRQIDIFYLHKSLESWSSICDLQPKEQAGKSLYWVDMDSDDGPTYQSRYKHSSSPKLYGINLYNVLELINNHLASSHNLDKVAEIPIHLRQSLLAHLSSAWNQEHSRLSPRQPSNIEVEACIGLKQAHQQLLGSQSFDEFLNLHGHKQSNNLNVDSIKSSAISQTDETSAAIPSPENQLSKITATDISKQGYCLRWPGPAPKQIKSGEIILLKHPKTGVWQVGTIRWAQRLNGYMYAGIKILSDYAQASAACTTLEDGSETPFFRTLLLSEKTSDKAKQCSLITPSIPFAAQQQIQLQAADDECCTAQLNRLLHCSGTISQFSYRPI